MVLAETVAEEAAVSRMATTSHNKGTEEERTGIIWEAHHNSIASLIEATLYTLLLRLEWGVGGEN